MAFPAYQIVAKWYKVRIYQPGFGPRIISAFMSDLQAGDLSTQTIFFVCPGGIANLVAGFTNYLAGDIFFDPTAGVLYGCTKAGTKTSATWQPVSGGGGYMGDWNPLTAYTTGSQVRVPNTVVYNDVTVLAATYGCNVSVPANPAGVQIPQFPEPPGRCWTQIAFTAQSANGCAAQPAGYANATVPL